MNSIIYILEYYGIKYYIDRNINGDHFLDVCKLANHHFMLFDLEGNLIRRDRWNNFYHYMKCIVICKHKL